MVKTVRKIWNTENFTRKSLFLRHAFKTIFIKPFKVKKKKNTLKYVRYAQYCHDTLTTDICSQEDDRRIKN